jgi:hypothetical protein
VVGKPILDAGDAVLGNLLQGGVRGDIEGTAEIKVDIAHPKEVDTTLGFRTRLLLLALGAGGEQEPQKLKLVVSGWGKEAVDRLVKGLVARYRDPRSGGGNDGRSGGSSHRTDRMDQIQNKHNKKNKKIQRLLLTQREGL